MVLIWFSHTERKARGAGIVSHHQSSSCKMSWLPSANGGYSPWAGLVSQPEHLRDPGGAEVMSPLSRQSLGMDLGWSHGYSF